MFKNTCKYNGKHYLYVISNVINKVHPVILSISVNIILSFTLKIRNNATFFQFPFCIPTSSHFLHICLKFHDALLSVYRPTCWFNNILKTCHRQWSAWMHVNKFQQLYMSNQPLCTLIKQLLFSYLIHFWQITSFFFTLTWHTNVHDLAAISIFSSLVRGQPVQWPFLSNTM